MKTGGKNNMARQEPGKPKLEAVVESPERRISTWVPLPDLPGYPEMIRLSSSSSEAEVAAVVAQLTVYGGTDKTPLTMEQLVNEPVRILPGGLQAVSGETVIAPSCCCGLETWREWIDLLKGGGSPWLGHDPAPWVEKLKGSFVVHSDGGLGEDGGPVTGVVTQISFSRSELEAAVELVQTDLAGFLMRLEDWARGHKPDFTRAFVSAFDRWFQITSGR